MGKYLYGASVVLTGASSGLGREMAKILVKKYGCQVIGIGRNSEKMASLVKELGEHFTYRLFDVSIEENWQAFACELKSTGKGVDLLINNAGMLPRFSRFEMISPENFERVMAVNFNSSLYAIRALYSLISASKRGGIVNVSSSAALCPLAGTTAYSASKGALKNFTEAYREEHPEIYVGLICPGFSQTDIFRDQPITNKQRAVDFISMPPEKMAKKMICGISERRKRMILGADAKCMALFTKLFPTFSLAVYRKFMKRSKMELFEDIFTDFCPSAQDFKVAEDNTNISK